jgi:hypothetical protein
MKAQPITKNPTVNRRDINTAMIVLELDVRKRFNARHIHSMKDVNNAMLREDISGIRALRVIAKASIDNTLVTVKW